MNNEDAISRAALLEWARKENSMNKLKPCPFCGGEAVIVDGTQPRNIGKFSVVCGMCFCATPWEINQENAEFTWNRRADNESDSV